MSGRLYLVGTPIGNLEDFSPRGVRTLSEVDFIAAEDTRVTMKLLNHFGIRKPLVSYYEHNKTESGKTILSRILAGETCALVSDAGMPAISDPGQELTAMCAEAGVEVLVIPGPCAAVSALALSGLPTGRFTFEGFLSVNKKARRQHLEELREEKRTMIFYEAPHKLAATLQDLLECFGERRLSLCRELTKLHEETLRTTLSEAARSYADGSARGEFVLIVEGCKETQKETPDLPSALNQVRTLTDQGMSLRDAVKQVSASAGISKNTLYSAATRGIEEDT